MRGRDSDVELTISSVPASADLAFLLRFPIRDFFCNQIGKTILKNDFTSLVLLNEQRDK